MKPCKLYGKQFSLRGVYTVVVRFTWTTSVIVKVLEDHGVLVFETEDALHSMLYGGQWTHTHLTYTRDHRDMVIEIYLGGVSK